MRRTDCFLRRSWSISWLGNDAFWQYEWCNSCKTKPWITDAAKYKTNIEPLSLPQTTTITNHKLLHPSSQFPESGNYPEFINSRIIMFWVDGDRRLPNSLWEEIYRSLEKWQSPSQSYFALQVKYWNLSSWSSSCWHREHRCDRVWPSWLQLGFLVKKSQTIQFLLDNLYLPGRAICENIDSTHMSLWVS